MQRANRSTAIMNDFNRERINKNIEILVESTLYDQMKQDFLRKDVFTNTMFEIIENETEDLSRRSKMMYTKLTHRGPSAFQKLLEILKENNYSEAFKILNSQNPAQTYNNAVTDENQFLSIKGTMEQFRNNSNSPSSPNEKLPINGNQIDINQINNNITTININAIEETDGLSPSKMGIKSKPKLEPYTNKTSFNIENLEVKRAEIFGTHHKLPVYSMKSKKRGVFFFVNIIKFQDEKTNRRGAERDRENLVTLFREMNFTIFYFENLSKVELHELIRKLITSDYLKQTESFFLCIQTHGDLLNNQTIMEFSDGSREFTDEIISMFSNTECPVLIGKPKVFLFPFCRGKISDKLKNVYVPVIETDGRAMNEMTKHTVPTFSDQLICYGTVPGFMTHRDIEFGSWYVRELCRVFAQHAYDCHIEDMLKLVGLNTMMYKEKEGRTQVTSTENRGFNKLLFLNPKIQE